MSPKPPTKLAACMNLVGNLCHEAVLRSPIAHAVARPVKFVRYWVTLSFGESSEIYSSGRAISFDF